MYTISSLPKPILIVHSRMMYLAPILHTYPSLQPTLAKPDLSAPSRPVTIPTIPTVFPLTEQLITTCRWTTEVILMIVPRGEQHYIIQLHDGLEHPLSRD